MEADEAGIAEIASRSRGTPRIANRLLRRVRDWAQVHGDGHVDLEAAHAALALFDVDDAGLDRLDRAVLEALCRRFGGGPVGLSTLAVAVGEEADTVETVAEPYLVREGYIVRTPRGRAAAARAWRHLGLEPPRRRSCAGGPPARWRGRRRRRAPAPRAVLRLRTGTLPGDQPRWCLGRRRLDCTLGPARPGRTTACHERAT